MADRRPLGEKEYNPLDDSLDLINRVVTGRGAAQPEPKKEIPKQELPRIVERKENIVELKKPPEVKEKIDSDISKASPIKEETVTFKFSVPRSDFVAAKKIVAMLEGELNARIDLANLGRGWLTRLITAEKELLDAAKHQQKLKTPNNRDPLQIAEVDHAMTVIQSVAFRRAEAVK